MKNTNIVIPLGLLAALLSFAACNKENNEPEDLMKLAVNEIVTNANQDYLKATVSGGSEELAFYAENDGLIEEYIAREAYFGDGQKHRRNKLIRCLRSQNLTEEQTTPVRRVLIAYEKRNERLEQRHREAYARLNIRVEEQRNEWLRQLRAGEINRVEFQRRMAILRDNFQQALLRIKQANADDFSQSYRLLMNELFNILDEQQWQGFRSCMIS